MELMGITSSLTDVRLDTKNKPIREESLETDSKDSKDNSNSNMTKKIKDNNELKKLIKEQKIKNIKRKFIAKLKFNNINSEPVQFLPYNKAESNSVFDKNGFDIPDWLEKLVSFLVVINILLSVFVETTYIAFPKIVENNTMRWFLVYSLIIFSFQFVSSLLFVKMLDGKKLMTIGSITKNYLDDGMLMDLAYLIVLVVDLVGDAGWFRLIILLKLPECFQRIQKIENSIINTFYKEQYWGLAKVFLLNFSISHILSILLILMSELDTEHSWMIQKQIHNVPWTEQYIWAFYWGTTIMLTVGFGDISPANYKEALCVVMIETFSCLCLAYNINCVGNLISNIKSQDVQKNRNIKTFKILTSRNNLSENLEMKIHNYIEESTNIKKKFNFQEESKFISTLPRQLKADFLKESNKKIFQRLLFFKNLTQSTLLSFAEAIQMKICHPEEIIRKRGQTSGVMILKEGKIGLSTKLNGSHFNNTTIQTIFVNESDEPFLLSLDFISNDRTIYEMKSEEYSILYFMDREKTLEALKTSEMDYEHFCFLRDKAKNLESDFEVFSCENCRLNHSKFECPKLHYVPLKKHVVDRYLHTLKISKSPRMGYDRQKTPYNAFVELTNNFKFFDLNSYACASSVKYASYRNKAFKQNLMKKAIEESIFQRQRQNEIADRRMSVYEAIMTEEKTNPKRFSFERSFGPKDISMEKRIEYQFLADYLKDELGKMFSNKDEVWLVECDEIKDFKFYFLDYNPSSFHLLLNKRKSNAFFG